MANSLADLKAIINELASKIDAPVPLLPTYGHSIDGAHPHVELDRAGLWHYVIVERGQELERNTTNLLDDLLYWIFADVTFSMSVSYEGKNRVSGQDFRRIMFRKQEELLGELNENWRRREEAEHQGILAKHPFDA